VNSLTFLFASIFAAAILMGMIGLMMFFRHLPKFLQHNFDNPVAVHRFRYQQYVDWLSANNKATGHALALFASGMAIALMAFPFLLVL
jgi:flagellar biosynthesis protein FlhB